MARAVVWGAWFALLVADVGLVWRFGSNVPRLDDWAFVPAATGNEPLTASALWSQWNEHRLPLPRLVLAALFRLSGGDYRSAMYCNVAILGLLAAAMIRAAAAARGATRWEDLFFPAALLNWGHAENLLWSWQVGFVLSAVLAGAALVAIVGGTAPLSARAAVAVGICVLALPLCGANGLAFAAPLAVWMVTAGLSLARDGKPSSRRAGACLAALGLAGAFLVGGYFAGYRGQPGSDRPRWPDCVWIALQFLSHSLGVGPEARWLLSGPTILAAGVAAAALCLVAAWRRPEERVRATGVAAMLAGAGVLAAGLGWGRTVYGPLAGLQWRYVTLGTIGACATYFAFALYAGPRWGRWLPSALALAALAALGWGTWAGYHRAKGLREMAQAFERDARLLPPTALADAYRRTLIAPYGRRQLERWPSWIDMLRRAGAGPFRHTPADPPWRVEVLDGQNSSRVAGGAYDLKRERFVYAVRVRYVLRPGDGQVLVVCSWGRAQPGERVAQRSVPREAAEESVLFWVDQPLRWLRIHLNDPDAAGRILSVELLVPEPSKVAVGSLHRVAGEDAEVAGVAPGADEPAGDGALDGAAVLVRVRAIGVSAQVHERVELDEEALDLACGNVPKLELPQAGRVHHPATSGKLNELCRRGRVPALLVDVADVSHLEAEAGLDGVEER